MFNQELINYIKEQLRIGTPRDLIKDVLMTRGGWTAADVDEAIRLATGQPKVVAPTMPLPPTQTVTPQGPVVSNTTNFAPQSNPVIQTPLTAPLQQAPFTADGFRPATVVNTPPPLVQPVPLDSSALPAQTLARVGSPSVGLAQPAPSSWATPAQSFATTDVRITENPKPSLFVRLLKTFFVLFMLGVCGFGGWYVYTNYVTQKTPTVTLSSVAEAYVRGVAGGSFDLTVTNGSETTGVSGVFTKDSDATLSFSGSLRRSTDPAGAKPTAVAYTGKSLYAALPDETTTATTLLGSLYIPEKFISQKIFGVPFALSGEYLNTIANPDFSQSMLSVLIEILGKRGVDTSASFFAFSVAEQMSTLGTFVGEEPLIDVPTLRYKMILDPVKVKTTLETFASGLSQASRGPFVSYFDTIASIQGDIWIGKNDTLPYQIILTLTPKDTGDGKTIVPIVVTLTLKDFIQSGTSINGKTVSIPKDALPLSDMLLVPPGEREKGTLDQGTTGVTPEHPLVDENYTAVSGVLGAVGSRAKAYYAKNKTYVGLCLSKDPNIGLWPVILDIRSKKSKSPTCRESSTQYAMAALVTDKTGAATVLCVDNTTASGFTERDTMPTTPSCQ